MEKAVLRKTRCLNLSVLISSHLHMQELCCLGRCPALLVVIIDDPSFSSCIFRFDQFSSVLLCWKRALTSSWCDFSAHQISLLRMGTCQGASFTGFLQAALVTSQSLVHFSFTVLLLGDVGAIWEQSIWESTTALELAKILFKNAAIHFVWFSDVLAWSFPYWGINLLLPRTKKNKKIVDKIKAF